MTHLSLRRSFITKLARFSDPTAAEAVTQTFQPRKPQQFDNMLKWRFMMMKLLVYLRANGLQPS